VDDEHPGCPRRIEQRRKGFDDALQLRDVVAECFTETARQQEVPLHVDDDQCGVVQIEFDRTG
jgi:hypothetical protein